MYRKVILISCLLSVLLGSLFLISPASAEYKPGNDSNKATDLKGQVLDQIKSGASAAELQDAADPRRMIAWIIAVLLGTVGMVFLVLIVVGSYWYITSHGDEERITKARNTIRAAIIGLVIIMIAYSITKFVVPRIQQAVTEGQLIDQ